MPRRFITIFAAIMALTLGAVGLFNYAVDPLQFYRIARWYPARFFPAMERFESAGLARNYADDVIVIGTSVTENFLPSHIRNSWGRNATKLAMAGSTAHEQYLVAETALATGRIKTVLWGLDQPSFAWPARAVRDDQAPFPYYLYRKRGPNLEYLLSLSTLRLSLLALNGNGVADLDQYEVWYDRFELGAKAVLKDWKGSCASFRAKYEPPSRPEPAASAELQRSIELNLTSLIRAYPDVTFEFFLPPLATLYFVPVTTPVLDAFLPFRTALANTLLRYPNVRLRDFQTIPWIVDDLANFKDPNHFGLAISDYIIDAVRDDRDRLLPGDIAAANARLVDLVNRYELCRDGNLKVGR